MHVFCLTPIQSSHAESCRIKKMKNSATMARLLVLGVVAVMVVAASWEATSDDVGVGPPCPSVNDLLHDCVDYIENSVETPPKACCDGVIKVNALAPTQSDLVGVCNCIKASLAALAKPTNSTRISHLPQRCGVDRHFPPVDASYDCIQVPPAVRRL